MHCISTVSVQRVRALCVTRQKQCLRKDGQYAIVRVLVRWATGKRLTNFLPNLDLTTLYPPSEQRGFWSSYEAVRV